MKIKSNEKKKSTYKKNNNKKSSIKQQNLNFSTLTSKNVLQLQKKIGNKQSMIFLKELGDLMINDNNGLESYFGSNEDMETRREITDFKELSSKNTLNVEDAIKSGRFSVNHNDINKPDISSGEILDGLDGLINMVNFLKGYDSTLDDKNSEVKNMDRLINPLEKRKRKEIDMIIKMVKDLPSFDENEDVLSNYMKVQNILISSGCDLGELFRNNGNIKSQKQILLKSLVDRR